MRFITLLALAVGPAIAIACSSTSSNVNGDAGSSDGSTTGDGAGKDSSTSGDGSDRDTSTPDDSGTTQDSAKDSAPTCTGPTTVDFAGCVEVDSGAVDAGGYFVDGGATDQTITFSGDKYGGIYDPNCLKIKAGTKVTWNVPFVEHPLLGAPCNPSTGDQIPVVSSGTSTSLTFNTVGVYGYKCQFHGGGGDTHAMKGVVVVY